jgi:glycerophosphoryl diester phosphodiesterase
MSFSYTALQRVERLAPGLRLVQLIERARNWTLLSRVVGPDWILGPGIAELRDHPKLGRRIAEAGHEMHVWTVNRRSELDLCLELGVTAVISDRPAHMLELLGR